MRLGALKKDLRTGTATTVNSSGNNNNVGGGGSPLNGSTSNNLDSSSQSPLSSFSPQSINSTAHSRLNRDASLIREQYTFIDEIGTGAFGRVFRAVKKNSAAENRFNNSNTNNNNNNSATNSLLSSSDDDVFAIKHVDKRKAGAAGLKSVLSEVETLALLNHQYIVKLEEVFQDRDNLYIVMELVPGGELASALKQLGRLHEGVVKKIVTCLLYALEYVHSQGIVHRDLKPANCLLSADGCSVKIADFGFAVMVGPTMCLTENCGTPAYQAPEIVSGGNYGRQVDLWALGVMTYLMLSGDYPFMDNGKESLVDAICRGRYSTSGKVWESEISAGAKDFISKLLTVDPMRRWSATQCLDHNWVKTGRTAHHHHHHHHHNSGDIIIGNTNNNTFNSVGNVYSARNRNSSSENQNKNYYNGHRLSSNSKDNNANDSQDSFSDARNSNNNNNNNDYDFDYDEDDGFDPTLNSSGMQKFQNAIINGGALRNNNNNNNHNNNANNNSSNSTQPNSNAAALVNASTNTAGAAPTITRPKRGRMRLRIIFRGAVTAVRAGLRLLFLIRLHALRKEGLDSFPMLRQFSFVVTRRYAPPNPTQMMCKALAPGNNRVLSMVVAMFESCPTVEIFDLSNNKIDSLDLIQQVVRAANAHPNLQILNLDNNPIPPLAGRGLLRLARFHPSLRSLSCQGTNIGAETITQIITTLKENEKKRPTNSGGSGSLILGSNNHGVGLSNNSFSSPNVGNLDTARGNGGSGGGGGGGGGGAERRMTPTNPSSAAAPINIIGVNASSSLPPKNYQGNGIKSPSPSGQISSPPPPLSGFQPPASSSSAHHHQNVANRVGTSSASSSTIHHNHNHNYNSASGVASLGSSPNPPPSASTSSSSSSYQRNPSNSFAAAGGGGGYYSEYKARLNSASSTNSTSITSGNQNQNNNNILNGGRVTMSRENVSLSMLGNNAQLNASSTSSVSPQNGHQQQQSPVNVNMMRNTPTNLPVRNNNNNNNGNNNGSSASPSNLNTNASNLHHHVLVDRSVHLPPLGQHYPNNNNNNINNNNTNTLVNSARSTPNAIGNGALNSGRSNGNGNSNTGSQQNQPGYMQPLNSARVRGTGGLLTRR